jgi:thermostable 8-oxoguanine DNA glycosylase
MDKNDKFDFDRADKAIRDYAKATGDEDGSADLMIYYVECGNKFTLDCGDIDELFYDALIERYRKAIEKVRKMLKKNQEPFRKRLEKIMKSADGIGWGYHDDLCHFYYESFQCN